MLLSWLWNLKRTESDRRIKRALAFAIPTIVLAFAFLLVNKEQNGSFFKVSYIRYVQYMEENGYRFSFYRSTIPSKSSAPPRRRDGEEASARGRAASRQADSACKIDVNHRLSVHSAVDTLTRQIVRDPPATPPRRSAGKRRL